MSLDLEGIEFFLEPCGFFSLTSEILLFHSIGHFFFFSALASLGKKKKRKKIISGCGGEETSKYNGPPGPHLVQIFPSQDVMCKKQEKYSLFQCSAGFCLQRKECLLTLWVFICFLTHMLPNHPGPPIPFPPLPEKIQCSAGLATSEGHHGAAQELRLHHPTPTPAPLAQRICSKPAR